MRVRSLEEASEASMTRCAWIDVKTSGPNSRLDVPFEIAVILTDGLDTISSLNLIVKYPDPKKVHIQMTDEDRRLYTKNGLLGALPFGVPLPEVDAAVADFIRKNTPEGEDDFQIAGKSLNRIEPFLTRFFPKAYRLLEPDPLDLDSVAWFMDLLGRPELVWVPDLGRKAHRAMIDIEDHLEEARHYKDTLGHALADRI